MTSNRLLYYNLSQSKNYNKKCIIYIKDNLFKNVVDCQNISTNFPLLCKTWQL